MMSSVDEKAEHFVLAVNVLKEYKFAKQKYDDEAAELGKKLSEARTRKKQLNEVLTLDNKWLVAMQEAENRKELSI